MSKAQPLLAVEPRGLLIDNAPQILYTRYTEMLVFAAHIQNPLNVLQLHSMRIAAKRLRYTLEIFAPAYTARTADFDRILADTKKIQEQIGDIHDCDIRVKLIGEYLDRHVAKRPEIRSGLQNLIAREQSTRGTLYAAFLRYWNDLTKSRALEQRFVDVVFSARL
jgi:CHAD domain-containing protein